MFDYNSLAEELRKVYTECIPSDFATEDRDFLSDIIFDIAEKAGKGLNYDDKNNYTDDEKGTIVQVIAEWTLYKGIDLIESQAIPDIYYKDILYRVAHDVYDLMTKIEMNKMKLSAKDMEPCAREAFTKYIHELPIDISKKEKACGQSCYEIVKKEMSSPLVTQIAKIILCLILVISIIDVFLYIVPTTEFLSKIANLSHLFESFIETVGTAHLTVMFIAAVVIIYAVVSKIMADKDIKKNLDKLEQVKYKMRQLVNPNVMYERLGVDIISVSIGSGLLCVADPDENNTLIPKIVALRKMLTDELGYIIPPIRVIDAPDLNENEYTIELRGNKVASGFIYPSRYMVVAKEWEKTGSKVPDNAIVSFEPVYQVQAYWIDKECIENDLKVAVVDACDVIINHLQHCCIKNVDKIMTKNNVLKFMELVKTQDAALVYELIPTLISVSDLRNIFVNLIREKVSIKDIVLIFERLCDYARFSNKPDILSERLRKDLALSVCLSYCDKDKNLYAFNLSKEITDELLKNLELQNDFNKTKININEEYLQKLTEKTAYQLKEGQKKVNIQPVIICKDELRLPIYRIFAPKVPHVAVIAEGEVDEEIKPIYLGQISFD